MCGDYMMKSLGKTLQNWLIRNKMNIYHPLFVDAVDHAFENEVDKLSLSQDTQRTISSATTGSSPDHGSCVTIGGGPLQ
jgi:hypothetical protein